MAIRVARGLEHPATQPERFTDASGHLGDEEVSVILIDHPANPG